ncbi:MAG TPA: tryptophan synthase subunit alpha [Pseudomonas xinjiangensis]|uniref:Tryptophan synthase alpha chain n=2 Tax=root TaxID=1 RepID=A0A7V1BTI0_9GAMM|nr:tryptophan synthase subunit alpha [Halopseudomonas xinjiangensis]HEC47268.1 tryptophan synthase subunit alpha [Halopseudomonas xinjiangensis]
MSSRLDSRFTELKQANRAALVTYICAGDPGYDASLSLLKQLPAAGADIIELGMPFSDPMADGPTIQAAALRALNAGQTQLKTLQMVRDFRAQDSVTPLVLMGYYNPIHRYGAKGFMRDASEAGVDGLLIVDLPAEHDSELGPLAREYGLDMIRMATPTTDATRLPVVLERASGFLYYVSLNGVTGVGQADNAVVARALGRIREHSDLPICVGFGVRTPAQAAAFASAADGVIVGSALVDCIGRADSAKQGVADVLTLVSELAEAIRSAR